MVVIQQDQVRKQSQGQTLRVPSLSIEAPNCSCPHPANHKISLPSQVRLV